MASRRQTKRPRFRTAWVALTVFFLTCVGLGGAYLLKLDREIVSRFEGRRWRLPSKIYSDTLSLYTGGPFKGSHIRNRLRRLGYQPAKGKSLRRGEYRSGKQFMEIHLHDFLYPQAPFEGFPVRVEVADGRIDRITDLRDPPQEIFSVDLEPELITGLFEQIWEERKLVKLSEVPEHLVNAVIAVEDQRFYEHFGVDVPSIARALLANLKARRIVQGASTLTQQLVKNLFLTPQKTLSRKIREALMALILEIRYSKGQILEAYLNEIYFGQRGSQGIYGVGEATEFYFGSPVREVSLAESAVLAGLIRSPALYSPHKNQERIRKRRDGVLKKMWGLGMISEDEYNEATKKPVEARAFFPEQNDAPYFVDYVVKELEKEYSLDILTSEGLLIFTTLDVEMQNEARRAVQQGLKRLETRHPSLKESSSEDPERVLQACLFALEPQTGFIRAMIGGRDYKESQFNRIVQARRQPGSLFKPIVYVTALAGDSGEPVFTAASLVRDEPIRIRHGGKDWNPNNFNGQFLGEVTVRMALENSLNCATVWLSQRMGLGKIIETARRLGFTSPLESVPSLVLGAFETVPIEMASAFGAFANQGVLSKPRAIKKVLDKQGRLLERRPMELNQAISPEVAYLITYLLKGVFERGTARYVSGRIKIPAAGKTGTTNDNRDAWFAGYTPRLVALVWVGYDKPESIGLTGSQAALPIWADFIRSTSDMLVTEDFVPPAGIVFREIDRISGMLANRTCPQTVMEAFLAGTEPTERCALHPDESVEKGPEEERGLLRRFLDLLR